MASLDEYYASKMRYYENCESDDEVLLIILMMKLYKNIYKDIHVYCCVLTQFFK